MTNLKEGDKVRIANEEAMGTAAGVEVGETGKIVNFQDDGHRYAHVKMDKDPSGWEWSIPVDGLELIS